MKETIWPPEGADRLNVASPLHNVPPKTVDGVMAKLTRVGGDRLILRIALSDDPLQLVVIVACVEAATGRVVTSKIASVLPEEIKLLAGVTAFGLFDLNVTTCPPGCAGLLRVTNPLEDAPPVTVEGVSVKLLTVGTT